MTEPNQRTPIPHSVPVPRIYKKAAAILKSYCNKQGSLKKLVYEENVKVYYINNSKFA